MIVLIRQFAELCCRLGAPELGQEEDYKHNELRVRHRSALVMIVMMMMMMMIMRHRSALVPALAQIIKQKTNSEWSQLFEVMTRILAIYREQSLHINCREPVSPTDLSMT